MLISKPHSLSSVAAQLMILVLVAFFHFAKAEEKPSTAKVTKSNASFSVPLSIFVDIAPYKNFQDAIEEKNYETLTQEQLSANTLAYAAKELQEHLLLAKVRTKIVTLRSESVGSAFVLAPDFRERKRINSRFQHLATGDSAIEGAHRVRPLKNGDVLIQGDSAIGVLYGVYALLQQLGFAWDDPYEVFFPSPRSMQGSLNWHEIVQYPRFLNRGFWIYGEREIPKEFAMWMARNRLNIGGIPPKDLKYKLGLKTWRGEHNLIQEEFSKPNLFENHPEWFSLKDGKRIRIEPSGTYTNPAFENIEAARYFADRITQRLINGDLKGTDILNLWPADDRFATAFDKSRKNANPTDQLLQFYIEVVKKLEGAYRSSELKQPVTVAGISYYQTMVPPASLQNIRFLEKANYAQVLYPIDRSWSGPINANLAQRTLNQELISTMRNWQTRANFSYGLVEYHNMSSYAGIALTDHLYFAENLQAYLSNVGENLDFLYAYMHPLLRNPGPRRLTNQLLATQSWSSGHKLEPKNVSQSSQEITASYFHRRYGKYSKEWQGIYANIAKSVSNASEMFGTNSLQWLVLQKQIWAVPFYTQSEVCDLIGRYRLGGAQELAGKFSKGAFFESNGLSRSSFVGLDESLRQQRRSIENAESAMRNVSDPLISSRMRADMDWFRSTASRYKLLSHAAELQSDKCIGGKTAHAIEKKMLNEIQFLKESSTTNDTLSPVDQRSFLEMYRKLVSTQLSGG
jgi:hypothetical protein